MSQYNIRYCIACEEEVAVEDGLEGHTILVGDSLPFDVDFCSGPFTMTPPPDNFSPDWDLQDEPDEVELAVMDLLAEKIKKDFGV